MPKDAIAPNFDPLLHFPDNQPRHDGSRRPPSRGKRMSHEQHIRTRFDRNQVARRVQAALRIIVPIAVNVKKFFLNVRKLRRTRREQKRCFTNDRQRPHPRPRLPNERSHAHRRRRNDLHHKRRYHRSFVPSSPRQTKLHHAEPRPVKRHTQTYVPGQSARIVHIAHIAQCARFALSWLWKCALYGVCHSKPSSATLCTNDATSQAANHAMHDHFWLQELSLISR